MAEPNSHEKRSTFVTVVAWVFIVIFSFFTLTALLQNIMVFSFIDDVKKDSAGQSLQVEKNVQKEDTPDCILLFKNNFNTLLIIGPAFFLVSLVILLSAIGLLMRFNGARILFISMLIMIITAILFLFIYKLLFSFGFSTFTQANNQQYSNFSGWLHSMTVLLNVFTIIIATGIMVGFILIIKKLLSRNVVLEFHPFLRVKETGGEATQLM